MTTSIACKITYYKIKRRYQGWLYSRFMVFGNGVMKSLYDRSEGFFRRQLILSVKEKEKDRYDPPSLLKRCVRKQKASFCGLWKVLDG